MLLTVDSMILYSMCFSLKMCLMCILLLSEDNNNNVISVEYVREFNGLGKDLGLDITLDFVSGTIHRSHLHSALKTPMASINSVIIILI